MEKMTVLIVVRMTGIDPDVTAYKVPSVSEGLCSGAEIRNAFVRVMSGTLEEITSEIDRAKSAYTMSNLAYFEDHYF